MKKWFLVITVLTVILSGMSCAKKPIPPAAISEIYALSEAQTWHYGKYVQVKAVEDRGEFCYIMIYIKSLPTEETTLKDALDKAKVFTRTFTENAVKILKNHNIDKDVSVWAQLLLKDGQVNVLGHTRYEGHTFHDFEVYDTKGTK